MLPISYPHVIDIPVSRNYEKVSLSNKVLIVDLHQHKTPTLRPLA